jgi:chaperone modulatory protein CbpM
MKGEMQTCQADLDFSLTLAEISRCCGVTAEKVLVLVAEGVLSPRGRAQREWRFDASDLARALRALRLERDLGINLAGAALAMDLIDEMQSLRDRVRLLEALFHQR